MDFEEFLWALGDNVTIDLVREHYQKIKPLGQINKSIFHKFREYLLVGGMPQAVVKYVETKDLVKLIL